MNEPPPPLYQVNVNVPDWLEGVVGKALAKRPEARYQQAADLAVALRSRGVGGVPLAAAGPVAVAPAFVATEGLLASREAWPRQPGGVAAAPTPVPGGVAAMTPTVGRLRGAPTPPHGIPVEEAPRKRGRAVPILIAVIALLVLALAAGGVYLAFGGKGGTGEDVSAVITVVVVPGETSTEQPPEQLPTQTPIIVVASPTPQPGNTLAPAATEAQAPAATNTQAPTATSTPAPTATNTPKPTSTATKRPPTPTKSTCPGWYQKPQPGKGVLLIENHGGNELQIEWVKGGSGMWKIPAKQGDVPGRLMLQLPPGLNELTDTGYFTGILIDGKLRDGWGTGVIRVNVEAGKAYISPVWFNYRSEEYVYPYDPPAGCK